MELGEKIRHSRQALGLSQRQLCGEEITRNMLSLIENGAAKPSMKTLSLLAERLGKPLSYFLDDTAGDTGDLQQSAAALRSAAASLDEGRDRYAAQLLEGVTAPELFREKLLLSAKLPGADAANICRQLPSLDEELLLRAEAAMIFGESARCRVLLEAAEDQASPRWNLIMGKLYVRDQSWEAASICLERAEPQYPEAVPLLEECFRELGDFRRAYEYACKQKR